MYYQIIVSQFRRAVGGKILLSASILIVAAFFCLSANLYLNSNRNIAVAEDAFSTVAYFEFFRDVDSYGNPTASDENGYIGRFSTTVEDFDAEGLMELPYVKNLDQRRLLSAYIPDAVNYDLAEDNDGLGKNCFCFDIIRFMIDTDDPVVLSPDQYQRVPLKITFHANSFLMYTNDTYEIAFLSVDTDGFEEELWQFDQAEDDHNTLTLTPGVEYFAAVHCTVKIEENEGRLFAVVRNFKFDQDYYGLNYTPLYNGSLNYPYATWRYAGEEQPFWLWKWNEVQNDPQLLEYFTKAIEAYEYSVHSFALMTTNALEGIPGFYHNNLYVKEGRPFLGEDYLDGTRVCIVSEKLATYQGWQVGDAINLNFYEFDGLWEGSRGFEGSFKSHLPMYVQDNGGFIDTGTYTIVGLWTEKTSKVNIGLHSGTETLLYNTILVPSSSVQNLDTVDAPASGSRLTVHLENGMMEEFLEAASKITLSESADEVRITAFDQGYSQAQDSLQSMLGTAQFLLVLSSVLLVVAGVLLAFFYTQSQKQNMALMRLLGCSRRQAGTMAMLSSLLILLPGGIFGTAAGHLLTDRVASAILNGTNTLDKPEYAGFREIFGVQAEVEFALVAQPAVSALALAVAAGLFLLGCWGFTLLLLRKEPREALADK